MKKTYFTGIYLGFITLLCSFTIYATLTVPSVYPTIGHHPYNSINIELASFFLITFFYVTFSLLLLTFLAGLIKNE